jgi:predicted Zn-dependent protease
MTTSVTGDRSELAARVLELVGQVAGDGVEADVHVTTREQALTRFAQSFIHQNVTSTSTRIRLRVAISGSWAAAETDRVDAVALRGLVSSAVQAARVRPADPSYPGLAPPSAMSLSGNWDDATAAAAPAARAGVVRQFVDAAAGLDAAGYVETVSVQAGYANTLGQQADGRYTSATVDGIARTPSSDGVARRSAPRLSDLDGAALGVAAAAKARAAADPVELAAGDYPVVLEPSCVRDLLAFLATAGFNGRAVAEGRSFVELGARQFDPAIQLWDDAGDEFASSLPYDVEGTPRRRLDLVVDGVTSAVTHDRRTAAALGGPAAGAHSTGHAVEGGERSGAVATNLRLGPGAGGSVADLVAAVERGLLVSDFWYTRVVDPRTTAVTGLTRNGVWLIEHGTLAAPVRNLRFTQSYAGALGPGRVLGVGSELVPLTERHPPALFVAPALRLAGWHFTGGSAG